MSSLSSLMLANSLSLGRGNGCFRHLQKRSFWRSSLLKISVTITKYWIPALRVRMTAGNIQKFIFSVYYTCIYNFLSSWQKRFNFLLNLFLNLFLPINFYYLIIELLLYHLGEELGLEQFVFYRLLFFQLIRSC